MIDTLEKYLEQYGWSYEYIDENTLLTGFADANEYTFPITISIRNDLVSMMITFQSDREKLSLANEKLLLMLRFNFSWPMVKIGLDDAFTIVLAIDLYKGGLNYNTFAFGLDILTETAQLLVNEFSEMIQVV